MPWSDWQVYGPKTFLVSETVTGARRSAGLQSFGSPPTTGDADVGAILEAQRALYAAYPPDPGIDDISLTVASNGAGFGTQRPGVRYQVSTEKTNGPGFTPEQQSFANSLILQTSVTYQSSLVAALDPFPPLLDTLVYGVDFAENPSTGEFVQYEADAPTFSAWLDQDVYANIETTNASLFNDTGNVGTLIVTPLTIPDLDIRIRQAVPPSQSWYTSIEGDPVDTLTLDALGAADGLEADETRTVTVPVSGATLADVTLVFQMDFQGTLPFPLADFAQPAAGYFREDGMEVLVQFATIVSGGTIFGLGPMQAVYDLPRFRYWIPGVQWHTVGGHYATIGGATMRILTPGVGWVDVVDGPA